MSDETMSFPDGMPELERHHFELLYWNSDMMGNSEEDREAINLLDSVIDPKESNTVRLAAWTRIKELTGYTGGQL